MEAASLELDQRPPRNAAPGDSEIIRPVIPAAKRAAGTELQAADPQLHGTALDAHRPIP